MAQIDARIPLGAIAPKFDNIQDIQARGMQLQDLGRQQQDAARADAERQSLRDLYARATGPDGKINNTVLLSGLAQIGQGEKIPSVQKGMAEQRKATTEADAADYGLQLKKIGAVRGVLGASLANPNVTQQDVILNLTQAVNRGEIDRDMGAEIARNIPPRQEQLRGWLMQQDLEGLDHEKRISLLVPKYDEQNRGGTISQGTINPLTGERTETGSVQRTASPDTIYSGNLQRDLVNQGVSYQTDASGRIVALPSKPGAGPIQGTTVLGPDGQPMQGNKNPLNDTQAKALLFGSRMKAANKIMEDMASQGTTMPSVTKSVVEGVPVVGRGLGALANMGATSQEQQIDQAQRDFVNAVLRRESGAAISPSEFSSAKQQYFPEVGDKPEKIAQKRANRELAIRGLLQEVPESQRDSIDAPSVPPMLAKPSAAPSDIEAILRKHGGK